MSLWRISGTVYMQRGSLNGMGLQNNQGACLLIVHRPSSHLSDQDQRPARRSTSHVGRCARVATLRQIPKAAVETYSCGVLLNPRPHGLVRSHVQPVHTLTLA